MRTDLLIEDDSKYSTTTRNGYDSLEYILRSGLRLQTAWQSSQPYCLRGHWGDTDPSERVRLETRSLPSFLDAHHLFYYD